MLYAFYLLTQVSVYILLETIGCWGRTFRYITLFHTIQGFFYGKFGFSVWTESGMSVLCVLPVDIVDDESNQSGDLIDRTQTI